MQVSTLKPCTLKHHGDKKVTCMFVRALVFWSINLIYITEVENVICFNLLGYPYLVRFYMDFPFNFFLTLFLFSGDVKCFKDDCYPLAFGVPAILMIIAIALFWCGRHKYKSVPLTGNIVWTVVKAMSYALKRRITTKVIKPARIHVSGTFHWMSN